MPAPGELKSFRYDVAFSFAGPHRDKVRAIAELVASQAGKKRVFFDEWYRAEILGGNMRVLLQRIYGEKSLMVVADLSNDYADRPWCQGEAEAIDALRMRIDSARDETARLRVFIVRFGPGNVPGVLENTGWLDGINLSAQEIADVILERLQLLKERLAEDQSATTQPAKVPTTPTRLAPPILFINAEGTDLKVEALPANDPGEQSHRIEPVVANDPSLATKKSKRLIKRSAETGATPGILSQEGLIKTAKEIVPSFKWAIGGAGLLALAAIVVKWKLDLATLFLVAGVLLVLGMAFVALQWISKLQAGKTSMMAAFVAWSLLLMLVASLAFVVSSAALNWPWPFRSWIEKQLNFASTAEPPRIAELVTSPQPKAAASTAPGLIDDTSLALPKVGDHSLRILSPTLLEVRRISSKQADPAHVDTWDFINTSGQLQALPVTQFVVTANGQPVAVQSVGFKRRPVYAPLVTRDLRIENCIYLQLAAPVADNQSVEVKNPGGTLWPATMPFVATADPLRNSPVIHVNQEGYVPAFPKKAMVGYYLGDLGEMNISASLGFKIVDARTGAQFYQGPLTLRPDYGYVYTPAPYQKVLEADFSNFTTPGQYRLVVPGFGASFAFAIADGVAMAFTRAYELGLYHQRCGASNALPFTRFTHDACHTAAASVPMPQSSFGFTWTTIAGYAAIINPNNPAQTAPMLSSPSAQLFPFVRQGAVDVSSGHHDAGDYSKYTINSATMAHLLMFSADSLAGVGALDNFGIPESGDGISDVLQEAKWEADYLAKLQDTDGGFYFLVYPKNREYESGTQPDDGDAQVVWPKTTSATAAAVAALAQCGSSPLMKQNYPQAAASYLAKATLGWKFLTNAIALHGKNGAYQKITHYGDNFTDQDELAWAAAEMYVATGNPYYQQILFQWFPDPTDSNTFRWGWWRMSEGWGNAVRSYAFAVRSRRLQPNQLDQNYLAKCITTITDAGNDTLLWSQQGAYGSSFPTETKRMRSAGWYFSTAQAFDIVVAQQLAPRPEYLDALVRNMNYEGGGNPVNVTHVTGLGWKRQREIVDQYSQSDRRVMPKTGIPLGNIQNGFVWVNTYGTELAELCYPSDAATIAPVPFYDRWGDAFNTTTEFFVLDQARGLGVVAYLAALTSLKTQSWTSATSQITAPTGVVPVGQPVRISLQSGLNLNGARIVWEGRDQEPVFGSAFTFTPLTNGTQWVEAEAQWPDGRRVFATANFTANSPNVVWVEDAVPTGGAPGSGGGDAWNWTGSNPAQYSGSSAHQSASAAGLHEHWFDNATATLDIGTGDTLYAYVYLDPASLPSEVMLAWNNGSWEHRAYWGANNITYGIRGTDSRRYMGPLPAAGQWTRLEVPASQVGLEGSTLKGMNFSAYGGRVTWDKAGVSSN